MALLCLCIAQPATATLPEGYTRSALSAASTGELARRFLGATQAARVESHYLPGPFFPGGPVWALYFHFRPEPFEADMCERVIGFVNFETIDEPGEGTRSRDAPSRVTEIRYHRVYALAPGCAALPGRRFANFQSGLPEQEGIAVLRALGAARAAAAGTAPLPFRLRCDDRSRGQFDCPADLRATLAALPVHQAFTVARHPRPSNCDSGPRDEGDAVEIGGPRDSDVWDVRLRHLGTERAEIVLIRQFPRTRVEC